MLKNSECNKPIFIVGMNGSGTTMLADCLNNHPDIYIHKVESRVIPYYAKQTTLYDKLEKENNFKALVDDFSNNYAFRAANNSNRLEIDFNYQGLNNPSLSDVIHITFSYFAQKDGKNRWGDHSPKYALFIPTILELFPDAKIIHIFRDGRDCALSFKNRFRQNIYRSIQEWKTIIKKARDDGKEAGEDRYFEIQYEKLTANPESSLRKICSFIDVPYNNRVLVSRMPMYREKERLSQEHMQGTIVKNHGRFKTSFTTSEIQKLEDISGNLLKDFGYELLYNAGDHDLSKLRLNILKTIDRINASIAFFKRYDGEDPLGTFFRGIKTSLKQGKVR